MQHITTENSSSGKQCIVMNPDYIYSPGTEDKLKNLPGIGNIYLRASARILNPTASDKGNIFLVVSIDDTKHKLYKYVLSKDSDVKYNPGEWFDLTFTDVIDRSIPVDGNYKVYVWYAGKNKIYVDDLKLEYMPVGYE
jgi:hypothetical protein